MGSGEDIFMDRPVQKDEQGLREVMCERRSVRVRCHESPYAEAASSRLRPFHTASEGGFSEVRGYKVSLVVAWNRLEVFSGGTLTAGNVRDSHTRYVDVLLSVAT